MSEMNRRTMLKHCAAGISLAASTSITHAKSSSSPDPWLNHDALGLADLIKRKEMSTEEIVEASIRQIEQLNPEINAVVVPLFERARKASSTPLDGPFTGVPTLIKDMEPIRFVRHTYGSRYFKTFISPFSTELIDRMDRSGFVTLGKTNLPEFGLMPVTEPLLFGPTRNPWNPKYSAGGSSGGSAAAVAAGMVPIAQGGDGAGSLRIPASHCGLFGLKPTRGRNPYGGGSPGLDLSVRHCLSRSVRDSAAFFDAVQGPLPGDRYWLPPPAVPMLKALETPLRALRVGVLINNPLGAPPHAECVRAVEHAAKACEELGHHVEPARWGIRGDECLEALKIVFTASAGSAIAQIRRILKKDPPRDAFEPFTWHLVEFAERQSSSSLTLAWQKLDDAAVSLARTMQKYDVLLTPVSSEPPPMVGELSPEKAPETILERITAMCAYSGLFNATGQPAMSVPSIETSEGLPIGAHFIGRFADEATLFGLAGQLETARPWKDRYPFLRDAVNKKQATSFNAPAQVPPGGQRFA